MTFNAVYDPTLVPDTLRLDVPPSGVGQEVAVAITRDGQAFMFGAESYAYGTFGNPKWKLERKQYDVDVVASSSGLRAVGRFRLDNRDADYATFRIVPR